jgi:hypothetical protein
MVKIPCQVSGFGIPAGALRGGYRGCIILYPVSDGVNYKSVRVSAERENAAMRRIGFPIILPLHLTLKHNILYPVHIPRIVPGAQPEEDSCGDASQRGKHERYPETIGTASQ